MTRAPGRIRLDVAFRRIMATVVVIGSTAGISTPGHGQAPVSIDSLRQMNAAQLETLYRQGTVVGIPEGPIEGTALVSPGTRRARVMSRGAKLVWQGKVFESGGATAVNRFFGMRIVRAQVRQGPSWLDGGPSLILDYSQTSRIYADNRDEIRQVAPGLFLGLMYDRTTAPPQVQLYFALQTRP